MVLMNVMLSCEAMQGGCFFRLRCLQLQRVYVCMGLGSKMVVLLIVW